MTEPGRIEALGLVDRDTGNEPVLGEQRGRGTFGDQHAALLHERLEGFQAVAAEAAARVFRRIRRGPAFGVRSVFLYGCGVPAGRDLAAIHGNRSVRVDDHVELRAQVALAHDVVAEVGIGDLQLVEAPSAPSPHPACWTRNGYTRCAARRGRASARWAVCRSPRPSARNPGSAARAPRGWRSG